MSKVNSGVLKENKKRISYITIYFLFMRRSSLGFELFHMRLYEAIQRTITARIKPPQTFDD